MARTRMARWVLASLGAMVTASCTTGANGDGFGSFTGPSVSAGPPGITTFEDSEGQDSTGSAGGTRGGSADGTGATGTTTGPDPGTTASEGCEPPCAADQMCVRGVCEPVDDSTTGPPVCHDVPGNYDSCLGPGGAIDVSGCDDPGATCISVGTPPLAGACAVDACADLCDCPFAPPTGNASITCGPLTGGANLCYLDCAGGLTCPDGMICFNDEVCIWPGDLADGEPYGDCFNGNFSVCGLEGLCLGDDAMTAGVCTEHCVSAASCPASPGGSASVTCQDITNDGDPECVLDCQLGSCPPGMICFAGVLCMWD